MLKGLYKLTVILFISVFLIQCTTSSRKAAQVPLIKKSDLEKEILRFVEIEEINVSQVKSDIEKFRSILLKKKSLSTQDWELHDSLLKTYVQLKSRPSKNLLRVPAKTKIRIPLRSYCLEPRRAIPQKNEIYRWKKQGTENVPHLAGLLRLSSDRKYSQELVQEIIWNLTNETFWEEYPESHKLILQSIDAQAPVLLPSKIKSGIKKDVLKKVEEQLPDSTKTILDLTKGPYYAYQDFEESLHELRSEETLPDGEVVTPVEGAELYTFNDSESFAQQETSFYNPSEDEQILNLNEYYQEPYRRDVQSLAAFFAESGEFAEVYRSLEKLLYDDMLRMGLGFTPILGDLIDLFEASTGRGFFNADLLTSEQRFMSAMGVLAGNGQTYRYAEKIWMAPKNYVRDIQKKYRQIKNMENYKALEVLSKTAHGRGIPDDWRVKVTNPGKNEAQGIEFIHPENSHTKIRVMPGKPGSEYENSRKPYVRVTKSGRDLGLDGAEVAPDTDAAHIPLDKFDFNKFPWGKGNVSK